MFKRGILTVVMIMVLVISISPLAMAVDNESSQKSVTGNCFMVSKRDRVLSEPGILPGIANVPVDNKLSPREILTSEPGLSNSSADIDISKSDVSELEPSLLDSAAALEVSTAITPPFDASKASGSMVIPKRDMLKSEPGFINTDVKDANHFIDSTLMDFTITENIHTPDAAYKPSETQEVTINDSESKSVVWYAADLPLKRCDLIDTYVNPQGQMFYVYAITYQGTLQLHDEP